MWPDPDYVLDDQTASARPAYWLSDAPAPNGLWARLRSEHARSGLWTLLLAGMDGEPARPWVVGEVTPESAGDVDGYDAAAFLSEIWAKSAEFRDDQGSDGLPHLAPFGTAWPGLAARGTLAEDPGELADHHAEFPGDGTARLGLVAVDRSADALAVTGWDGPVNYSDATSPLAAVVRSWEDRFGVRVVRIGFDTLDLSVAALQSRPSMRSRWPPNTTGSAPTISSRGGAPSPPTPGRSVARSCGRSGGTDRAGETTRLQP